MFPSTPNFNDSAANGGSESFISLPLCHSSCASACLRIGQPDGPWLRTTWNQRQMVLRSRRADKHKLLAVGRPARRKVTINAGRNIAHALLGQIKDRDESVVPSARAEGNDAFRQATTAARFLLRAVPSAGAQACQRQHWRSTDDAWHRPRPQSARRAKAGCLRNLLPRSPYRPSAAASLVQRRRPTPAALVLCLARRIRNVAFAAHL